MNYRMTNKRYIFGFLILLSGYPGLFFTMEMSDKEIKIEQERGAISLDSVISQPTQEEKIGTSLRAQFVQADIKMAQELLLQVDTNEKPLLDIHKKTKSGLMLIHILARCNKPEHMKLIISKGAQTDSMNKKGINALQFAAVHGSIEAAEVLLQHSPTLLEMTNPKNGWTSLHYAVQNNNKVFFDWLVSKGAAIDVVDYEGCSLMHLAVQYGALDIARSLHILNPYLVHMQSSEDGWAPIHYAARGNQAASLLWLIEQKVRIDTVSYDGDSPMHTAAFYGSLEVAKILHERMNDLINRKNLKKGYTPVVCAITYNYKAFVAWLLEHGASIDPEVCGSSVLFKAIDHNFTDIIKVLCAHDPELANRVEGEFSRTPLNFAAQSDNPEIIEVLISAGAQIYTSDKDGILPIHDAVYSGCLNVVKKLYEIDKKIITVPDKQYGRTPLIWAACANKVDIVEWLIEMNVDIDAKDNNVETAFFSAVQQGALDVAKFLLKRKPAFLNEREAKNGWSPLLYGLANNDHAMVDWLLDEGAQIEVFDNRNYSSLSIAVFYGLELVKKLIDHDKSKEIIKRLINAKDNEYGSTPLHIAAEKNAAPELIELLINHGAQVNALDRNSQDPLFIALTYSSFEVITQLCKNGSSLFFKTSNKKPHCFIEVRKRDDEDEEAYLNRKIEVLTWLTKEMEKNKKNQNSHFKNGLLIFEEDLKNARLKKHQNENNTENLNELFKSFKISEKDPKAKKGKGGSTQKNKQKKAPKKIAHNTNVPVKTQDNKKSHQVSHDKKALIPEKDHKEAKSDSLKKEKRVKKQKNTSTPSVIEFSHDDADDETTSGKWKTISKKVAKEKKPAEMTGVHYLSCEKFGRDLLNTRHDRIVLDSSTGKQCVMIFDKSETQSPDGSYSIIRLELGDTENNKEFLPIFDIKHMECKGSAQKKSLKIDDYYHSFSARVDEYLKHGVITELPSEEIWYSKNLDLGKEYKVYLITLPGHIVQVHPVHEASQDANVRVTFEYIMYVTPLKRYLVHRFARPERIRSIKKQSFSSRQHVSLSNNNNEN